MGCRHGYQDHPAVVCSTTIPLELVAVTLPCRLSNALDVVDCTSSKTSFRLDGQQGATCEARSTGSRAPTSHLNLLSLTPFTIPPRIFLLDLLSFEVCKPSLFSSPPYTGQSLLFDDQPPLIVRLTFGTAQHSLILHTCRIPPSRASRPDFVGLRKETTDLAPWRLDKACS